jgi:hypothetical protein
VAGLNLHIRRTTGLGKQPHRQRTPVRVRPLLPVGQTHRSRFLAKYLPSLSRLSHLLPWRMENPGRLRRPLKIFSAIDIREVPTSSVESQRYKRANLFFHYLSCTVQTCAATHTLACMHSKYNLWETTIIPFSQVTANRTVLRFRLVKQA